MHEGKFTPPTPEQPNSHEVLMAHNLKMMNDQMLSLIISESINGNTGVAQTESGNLHASAAANGYVDNSGKIVAFGNLQNISPEIRENAGAFTFHIAFDKEMGVYKVFFLTNKNGINEEVMEILRECMKKFNEEIKKI